MAINVAGIVLSSPAGNNFSLDNGATPWLKIDSVGRMTRQQVIAFEGVMSGGPSNYRTAAAVMGSVRLNSGNAWNNATGMFTCPVAGRYLAGMVGMGTGATQGFDGTLGYGYFGIAKSGVLQGFSHWNTASTWASASMSSIVDCVAGDTISFPINTAPAPAASLNGWYAGGDHGNFFIGLIK